MSTAVSPALFDRRTPAPHTPFTRPEHDAAERWTAAVSACMQTLLGRVFECLDQGLLLCDQRGRVLVETPALARSLDAEPERDCVRDAIDETIRTLTRIARGSQRTSATAPQVGALITFRELETASARYRIRGTQLNPAAHGEADTAIVVILERVQHRSPMSDETLQERFNLTDRELDVARLLAEGKGNSDIARTLGISPHTARRHTESVMLKLSVRSRAAVGAKLREG